ncbi:MAG: hypothetical protein HKN14_12780 [Marinicaulis sp.]|nr:hypothetical protein [Marinicaulis sp.]NNE41779.1 hypothetical protein [Marinicaulis sp.]NNL89399.1 hypothetical protein [Marinicaulis sp.]
MAHLCLALPNAPQFAFRLALVAAVIAAGDAAARTQWGYALIYGVASANWIFAEIIAAGIAAMLSAALAAIFSGLG